jgi:site-specific DNA-methyltransferase (adenine-specific)
MLNESLFSSDKQNWETPKHVFDYFNNIYHFTLDAAADDENHKCEKYYTERQDGLKQDWKDEVVWVNPPYSDCKSWIRKAYEECCSCDNTLVALLIPARTDTKAWFDYCQFAHTIYFLKGRVKFVGGKSSAPFPSAVVVFKKEEDYTGEAPRIVFLDMKGEGNK